MIFARAYRHGRIVAGHSVALNADFDELTVGYEEFAQYIAELTRKAYYWAPVVSLDVAVWLGPAGPLAGRTPKHARMITCAPTVVDARRGALVERAMPFLITGTDEGEPQFSPSVDAVLHHASCARLDAATLIHGRALTAREARLFLGARRDVDRRCRVCVADRVPSGAPHTT